MGALNVGILLPTPTNECLPEIGIPARNNEDFTIGVWRGAAVAQLSETGSPALLTDAHTFSVSLEIQTAQLFATLKSTTSDLLCATSPIAIFVAHPIVGPQDRRLAIIYYLNSSKQA